MLASERRSSVSERDSLTIDVVSDEMKIKSEDLEVAYIQNGKVVVNTNESVCRRGAACFSWSLAIMISSFLSCCIVGCMFISFSIFYMSFVEHFDAGSATTGWIGSLFLATGSILGLVYSGFIKFYGCRVVAVMGGFTLSFGFAISSLAPTIGFLYFSYGFVAGMGFNMVTLSSFVIVQQHFVKYRALAAGMSAAGISVGTLIGGPLVGNLVEACGWRGAMLILAGIAANSCVFGSIYRPVTPIRSSVKNSEIKMVDSVDTKPSADGDKNAKSDGIRFILFQLYKDMTNFSLFRNRAFALCCFGTFFMNAGMVVFYQHTPKRAVFLEIERDLAILLPTVIGVATLAARIIGSFIGNLSCTYRTLQYGLCIGFSGMLLTLTGTVTTFTLLAVLDAAIGFLGGLALTVQTTVMCDLVGVDHVARAQAFVLVFTGFGSLIGVPLAGWIFDKTNDYSIPFYTGGACQTFGGILITVAAILYRKNRIKK